MYVEIFWSSENNEDFKQTLKMKLKMNFFMKNNEKKLIKEKLCRWGSKDGSECWNEWTERVRKNGRNAMI